MKTQKPKSKVLLINPPFDYYFPDLAVTEPLSLAYLAAYLRKNNYEVSILDGVASNITKTKNGWHYGLSDREVNKRIRKFQPNLVGITCPFSLKANAMFRMAKLVKRLSADITTVVGGIHPTIFPKEVVNHKEIDYVIIGEGEESFLSLVKLLDSKKGKCELTVDGCAYKKNGKICLNSKKKYIENLDFLPFPARDLLPMKYYFKNPAILYGLGRNRAATVITSRSCPRRCTFCSMYLSHGSSWRARSVENVLAEIRLLIEKYRVGEIFFMDDNLTFDKKRMAKLCQSIIKEGLKFRWNTPNGVSASYLDRNLIRLMKKSGCANICVGIESGNDRIRNEIIKKGLSRETIYNTLDACKKEGLPVIGFFIIGIPGENEATFQDTLKMVGELPFSMIATLFYIPFPGTELYEKCLSKGYIKKDYWREKRENLNAPIVETPEFDKQKLKKWRKQLYYEFFKSHWGEIALTTLTFKNEFIKWQMIKRFIRDKFY